MRLATIGGRSSVVVDGTPFDVARESDGRFGPDPTDAFDRWDAVRAWADQHEWRTPVTTSSDGWGPPSPGARQVFGIGLNYRSHAAELGVPVPEEPIVFAKFPTCLSGPEGAIEVAGEEVDWEAELVVVISRPGRDITEAEAWDHVAGLTVGQDISDRWLQRRGPVDQLSFAKSRPTFGPTGPVLVTPDELEDRDDLRVECRVNGEVVQCQSTSDLVFGVAAVVAHVSRVVPLLPGDLVFTGTPAGCGITADPPRFLQPGDRLTTEITGIGTMNHLCVATSPSTGANEGSPCTWN